MRLLNTIQLLDPSLPFFFGILNMLDFRWHEHSFMDCECDKEGKESE
jgi:hypothetical protein